MNQELLLRALRYGRQFTVNGKVASYIPELAKADGNCLGACVITTDNQRFACGDCDLLFSCQSVVKAPILMFALENLGPDALFQRIGMEPTGAAFNSIVRLEEVSNKPANPLINAGAITVVSCLPGDTPDQRFQLVLDYIRQVTDNRELDYDRQVYLSEKATGHRNRALAYMLKSGDILCGDAEEVLDVYFRLCSLRVNCWDLARIGSTLAHDGCDVVSDRRFIARDNLRILRSLMATCGMYNASGVFATQVGLPAKSGVGGGILCAAPNKMGIGVYGPALDQVGNSVGGVQLLKKLSQEEQLSIF